MAQFVLSDAPPRRRTQTGLTRVWSLDDVGEAEQTNVRPFVHGVAWQGDQTLDPQPIEAGCSTPDTITINTTVPTIRSLPPFHLVQTDRCSNVGQQAQDLSEQRAIRNHQNAESWGLEQVLANGGGGSMWDESQEGIAYFQDGATVTTAAETNVALARAIGGLEKQYVDAEHVPGTHHVTLPVFYAMVDAGLAVRGASGAWETPGGFLISAGFGYTGQSPAGAAATPAAPWAYTTGDVKAWRDPVFETESFGHVGDGDQDNARITIVQRQYVLAPAGETWLGAQVAL